MTNEEAQIAALCPQSGGGGKTQGSESCGLPPLADGVFVTVCVRSFACFCAFCCTVVAAFLRAQLLLAAAAAAAFPRRT